MRFILYIIFTREKTPPKCAECIAASAADLLLMKQYSVPCPHRDAQLALRVFVARLSPKGL